MEKEKDIERTSSLDDYLENYLSDEYSFDADNTQVENAEPILSNNTIALEQNIEKIEMNKSEKYIKLQKFLSSYFKYELLEEGIDLWYGDFEFAFWCDSNDILELYNYLKSFDFNVVFLYKRFYHQKDDKQYYICGIADNSDFFDLPKYDSSEEESERISSLEDYQCEEEYSTLDTEEFSISESKKEPYFLNKKAIFVVAAFVILLIFSLLIIAKTKKNIERTSSLDYELPELESECLEKQEFVDKVPVFMPLEKIIHYDLCFETKDGKREFTNSTYEKTLFYITVNSYFGNSDEIKGIYIFPRYSVKAIYAEVVE